MSHTRRHSLRTAGFHAAAFLILSVFTPGTIIARASAPDAPAPADENTATTTTGDADDDAPKAPRSLRILILGGTGFLGPAIVNAAVERGHEMTLFNRGKTNPHLFPDLEKLEGDRDGDLDALEGRDWDAVIDTSGYVPRIVRQSAQLLEDNVQRYLFVSTVSVYRDFAEVGIDEDDPVATIDDPTVEQITGETYGPLKALCEDVVRDTYDDRATIIRPGLIVGPRDPTGRFTYWPVRIERGGEVLAPGDGGDPVQLIDVRDLAEFIILALEKDLAGTYNATGPEVQMTMAEMLHGIKAVIGGDAQFTWVPVEFLAQRGVQPWVHMPAWVPARDEYIGFGTVSAQRAIDAGLTFRPLADTVRDTLKWYHRQPPERQAELVAGIDPEHEQAVLDAWHARQDTSRQTGN